MPIPQLKTLSKKSGVSLKKIEKDYYPKAKKVAKDMGEEDNYAYIYGVLENMLGIEESVIHKDLADGFVKSNMSFKEYIESLSEEITSSDISTTPEKSPKIKVDDDEEDEDEDEDEVDEACDKKKKK